MKSITSRALTAPVVLGASPELRTRHRLAIAIATAVLGFSPTAMAEASDLEHRVEQLEQQIAIEENSGLEAIQWFAVVEVEGFFAEDFAGDDSSDIEVATVELGAAAQINDYVSANVLLLFEEPEGDGLVIDEATIGIAPPNAAWGSSFGRMYVPFGAFETALISDPLPLEIGETQETAAMLEFGAGSIGGAVYLFNGDSNDGGDDEIEHFGASVGYRGESGDLAFELGAGFISSIGDSDALGDTVNNVESLDDYVGGYNLYGAMATGPFTVVAEYMAAANSFEADELSFGGSGAKPTAYQLELGYGFTWGRMPAIAAISIQGTDEIRDPDEAFELELPETRLLVGVSVEPWDATRIAVQYASDDDYDRADGGSGNSADSVVVQLATEF